MEGKKQDKGKTEEHKQFEFLHEEVLNTKRRPFSSGQLVLLLIVCVVLVGTIVCLRFFGIVPAVQEVFQPESPPDTQAGTTPFQETGLKELLGEDETIAGNSVDELVKEALKDYKKENEGYIALKKQLAKVGHAMESSMATIVSFKRENWFEQKERDKSVTSGVILEASVEKGITILTDALSLQQDKKLIVYLANGKSYPAEILQMSTMVGIALVHIDAALVSQELTECLKPVNVSDLSDVHGKMGEAVVLIGNPYSTNRQMAYGMLTSVENSMDQTDVQYELMTTTFSDSGTMNGFICNMEGQILGMVIREHKMEKMKSMVAATHLKSLNLYIQRMLKGNAISYIGINGQEVTEEIVQKVDKDMPKGIYITSIDDQSPAFQAGLMRGDILVALEAYGIQWIDGYAELLQQYEIGTVVKLTVMRKGKEGYKPIVYDVTIGNH